jgi:hypothetical protein
MRPALEADTIRGSSSIISICIWSPALLRGAMRQRAGHRPATIAARGGGIPPAAAGCRPTAQAILFPGNIPRAGGCTMAPSVASWSAAACAVATRSW